MLLCKRKIKARRSGHLCGMMKVMKVPTTAYNIEEYMWGLEEDAPEVEVRKGSMTNCRSEKRNMHSQHAGQDSR